MCVNVKRGGGIRRRENILILNLAVSVRFSKSVSLWR
jgi:hypothetical protein